MLKAKPIFRWLLCRKFCVLLHGNYFVLFYSIFILLFFSGRYDIKVYANRLAFHGKSYDYKIPFNTISRMFLLPHKDQRHVFFVLSIHPPIRQGQTRYPFIVMECLAGESGKY
jgi:hypothetical protein